ncbi:hypothetical protein SLEP1_g39361 [Rubroshorea leprosula]|uniref:Secreted protein n=1 Tax=Rubroshorea leprosula TaxID=152421 RepID=A0AAV5L0C0_9ROSI|nr:hypothetical protein SLEP1_g39361 [Rubroshorea leprosula]
MICSAATHESTLLFTNPSTLLLLTLLAAAHEPFCSAVTESHLLFRLEFDIWWGMGTEGKSCPLSKISAGIPVPVNRGDRDGEVVPGPAGPVAIPTSDLDSFSLLNSSQAHSSLVSS